MKESQLPFGFKTRVIVRLESAARTTSRHSCSLRSCVFNIWSIVMSMFLIEGING